MRRAIRRVAVMFQSLTSPRSIAEFYHRQLPVDVREYLKSRGIPDASIHDHLLGWNGTRITIPVLGRDGEVASFRYAKSPREKSGSAKMVSDPGVPVDLYGWDTLAREPMRVVICEGEFDRLVLEARGFAAVTSTGGAGAFPPEWAPYFDHIRRVYVCFDRDPAGDDGAARVKAVLPQAKIVRLPAEVGDKGDVTDFFVRLGKGRVDFELLLAAAAAADDDDDNGAGATAKPPGPKRPPSGRPKAVARRAERLKQAIPIQDVIAKYAELRPSGAHLVCRCPFHEEKTPSFAVYPATGTYYCFGCRAHGDLVAFVMHKESMTFGQALEALERFRYTHELRNSA
jgi:DNA primase